MLREKLTDSQVLVTNAGFVSVGVRRIQEGDIVAFCSVSLLPLSFDLGRMITRSLAVPKCPD